MTHSPALPLSENEGLMREPSTLSGGLAWRRIADALEADIQAERYAAGDVLPASTVLAGQFGVHRHTVRQAFRHLAERGIVSVERGRGTIVLAPRFPYRIGRRVSLRTNFGAAGISVTGSTLSTTRFAAPRAVAEALAIGFDQQVFAIRTVSFADGVPVSTGLHYVDAARFPAFDHQIVAAAASITAALKLAGIDDYIRLSTRLSARPAHEDEARLLGLAPGAPVLQSIGIDALADRTPIHLVEGVFAGDRMELIVEPFSESQA